MWWGWWWHGNNNIIIIGPSSIQNSLKVFGNLTLFVIYEYPTKMLQLNLYAASYKLLVSSEL